MQSSTFKAKRLPLLLVLVSMMLFVVGCTGQVGQTNWLGITAEDGIFYVATGSNVVALDAEAKREVWSFPDPATSNRALLFYSTPDVQDGRVIIGDFGASGGMFSPKKITTIYALEDGERQVPPTIWSNNETPNGSIVAPVTLANDQIFFATSNNSVFAVDAGTGSSQWEFKTENTTWAKPLYDSGVVYIGSLDKYVHALDAETGDELWKHQLNGGIGSAPTLSGGRLYVPSFEGAVVVLNAGDGAEVFRAEAENWVWGTPVVDGGVIYYADTNGTVFAADDTTGAELWRKSAVGPITSSLIVDGNSLIIASEGDGGAEGRGQLLTLNKETGDTLWEARTALPLYSTPVVSNGIIAVAVRAENEMMSFYDVEDGSVVWTYAQPE